MIPLILKALFSLFPLRLGLEVISVLTLWNIFSIGALNMLDFTCFQKFVNGYIMFLVDQ